MLSTQSFLDISPNEPLISQSVIGNPHTTRTTRVKTRTHVQDHFNLDKSHPGKSYLARFRRITAKLHNTNLHGYD